jgi:hypothetical protein
VKRALVLALLLVLNGCETETSGPIDTGTPATNQSPAAPTRDFAFGEKSQTQAGNIVTIHAFETDVKSGNQFSQPEEGNMYAAIDVEACAGPTPEKGSMSVNPLDFSLQMPDNTRIRESEHVKEPDLQVTDLPPNECVRGWNTYEVPAGQKPAFVIYEGTSILKFRVP